MGVASKLAVATRERRRPARVQSAELPMWCWVANGERRRPRRCVASFAGSPAAQEALGTRGQGPGPGSSALRALNPDLTFGASR